MYARVSKTDESGEFLLSESAIKINESAGYYHLLTGILNSEHAGERSFVTLYGFTEILPGRITTDKIESADGKTYFDLLNGIIGGKISFRSISGSDEDLGFYLDETAQDIQDAQAAAAAAALKAQQAIDAAVANATYWSVKASSPVIYKDAINAATSGAYIIVSGELRSGTTSGGFITNPKGGGAEGTATASPVNHCTRERRPGKTSYTVRLFTIQPQKQRY